MSFCLIILAGGKSHRFNSSLSKPYQKIGSKSLIEITLEKSQKVNEIIKTIIVFNKKDKKQIKKLKLKNVHLVQGGSTRQESTFNALKHIEKIKKISNVLIHDAARPNFSLKLLKLIIKKMKKSRAVIPKIKIEDAVKQKFESGKYEYIVSKSRNNLFLTQTPQCFKYKEIYNLHKNNKDKYRDDDISLLMDLNRVSFIDGEKNNFKITDKADYINLKKNLLSKLYYGIGFDVHRLVPKRKLYLGGVLIKSKLGTLGHSDGDPVLHAITDSILGACKLGDIGDFFSDNDKKFKNIRSTVLLKKIIYEIKNRNYLINNLDINIIAEYPKIKKYKKKIINKISLLCDLDENKINIKGKTTEKLGVIGKEKAIACEVITSIFKYD